MRKALSSFAALLLVALALIATAPPAGATSSRWSVGTRSTVQQLVCCGPVTMSVHCLSGQTPIGGGYTVEANSHDVRRLTEYVNFGDGNDYNVTLDPSSAWGDSGSGIKITAYVLCVSMSEFSGNVLKVGTFATAANHLATGTVQCDPGWTALTGSIDPSGTGGTTLTSTPSNSGGAWTARSWSSDVGSNMYVFVHCVPTSDIDGLRVVTHSDAVGWGTGASANCATGMRPITGGTQHIGGDSGAITVEPRPTSTGWTSTTLSVSTGSITTTVLCVPSSDPHVSISGSTTPSLNSRTVHWDWSATDPSSAGGYTMTVACQVVHGSGAGYTVDADWPACSSPVELPDRPDGWIQLNVHATTSDGREYIDSDSILVDGTPPAVTFDDAAGTVYPTGSPHVPVHVTDNFYLQKVQCAVDAGAFTDCGNNTQGAKTLALSGLTDGTHTLHVKAIDINTNQKTYDRAFKVDTTAPTVTLTGPASPVTVATSALATWTGTDAVAGVGGYDTQWQSAAYNADFGAWSAPVASAATATSRAFGSLTRGSTYCFQQRATDKVGHTSGWTASRCTAIPLDDRDLAASSGWRGLSSSGWFLGTSRLSTTKGARLAITGVTLQRISVVAKKCATCGVLGVYVGSTLLARIDLHSSTSARKVIALPLFTLRTRTVTLKVLSSGKPVQVDALAVSRR